MKRVTYRELTLALGIVVALLVVLTLWVNNPAEQSSFASFPIPKVTLPTTGKNLISIFIDFVF